MTIKDWEGLALVIGAGDIGNSLADHLRTIAPKLDVNICGRNLNLQNGIYCHENQFYFLTDLI